MALPTEGPNDERRRTMTQRGGIASDHLPPQAAVTPQDELVAGLTGNPESIPSQALPAEVLDRANLRRALKQVRQNKGAPGLDGMTVEALPDYLRHDWPEIREQLETGCYRPQPVKRVENRQGRRGETPAGHSDGVGPFHTAGHRAGHLGAMGKAHPSCDKSAVDRPMNRKFRGFTVSRNGARLKVADKALDKLKDRVRKLTRRTGGTTFAAVVA